MKAAGLAGSCEGQLVPWELVGGHSATGVCCESVPGGSPDAAHQPAQDVVCHVFGAVVLPFAASAVVLALN